MGKIIRNGVPYGGSEKPSITLTDKGVSTDLNGLDIVKFESEDAYREALEAGEIAGNKLYAFPEEVPDSVLDVNSDNAIQNKVVAAKFNEVDGSLLKTFNINGWYTVKNITGWGLILEIPYPFTNIPYINIIKAEVFTGSWHELSYSTYYKNGSYLQIVFTVPDACSAGQVYLANVTIDIIET